MILRVRRRSVHALSTDLFGQFLERPSWDGETGPEALADPVTGELPAVVMDALADMAPPVIRFPGGTDVDFTDWTDLIDRVPGDDRRARLVTQGHRGGQVGNRFGLHEYYRLRDRLGNRTILVVNLLDGLARRRPLAEAARHAAGLVAYVNSPVGSALPAGMPDWPVLRAANGHPEPFGVDGVQLGNEWFLHTYAAARAAAGTNDAARAGRYTEVIAAYADAIRAVHPTVPLVIDGDMGGGDLADRVLADPRVRERIQMVAFHTYAPGPFDLHGGSRPDARALWHALSAMPGAYNAAGQCIGLPQGGSIAKVRGLGYEVVATEWNVNLWAEERIQPPLSFAWQQAGALGAAAFLNGMMRQGVRLATQSMLVGHAWGIAALRADPAKRNSLPRRMPMGMVTTMYRHHHGDRVLDCEVIGAGVRPVEFRLGWAQAKPAVAELDAVVTRTDTEAFLHVVHRGDTERMLAIDWNELPALGAGRVCRLAADDVVDDTPWLKEEELPWADSGTLLLQPRSITIARVPLRTD